MGGRTDSIYVFYSPSESIKGQLSATFPLPGTYQFDWSSYDTISHNWTAYFSESGVAESSITGLEEGGYRVRISNGTDVDTVFNAWIHLNDFHVNILYDTLSQPPKVYCGGFYLNAEIFIDTFYYYNLNDQSRIVHSPELSYLWTSDNPEMTIFNAAVGYESKNIGNPPFRDTYFILTAGDYSGMQDHDSVFYISPEVKSEFSMEFFDKAETEDFITPSSNEADAPLTVRFTNLSENGSHYEWIFSDTVGTFGSSFFENYETTDLSEQPEFTYKIPDDYYAKLVATSSKGCIDTFKLEDPIKVLPSELEAPNVFSPEGLEANRYFKVHFQSIKNFEIRIYTKTGNLVYKADVKDMYSWDGWDGNIMNTNRPAPAGMYYYIINATGYDEVKYNRKPYTGYVYLFRPGK